MKLLITGSSGFVAGHFIETAAKQKPDWTLFGIDRRAPMIETPGAYLERCDLLNPSGLNEVMRYIRPDAVLHLAAQSRVDPSLADPLATYHDNVTATINLLDAAKKNNVAHFVYVSSEQAVGHATTYPTPETTALRPLNPYGAGKAAADLLCQQFDSVLPTAVVRSGMGFGSRQNPAEQVVARFIVDAIHGRPLRVHGDGSQTRDLTSVHDTCRGLIRILEEHARGVWHLSGGHEYSVLEIANIIAKRFPGVRIEHVPTIEVRRGDQRGQRVWLDNTKARKTLGWEPENGFDGPGLDRVIAWYRDNIQAYP